MKYIIKNIIYTFFIIVLIVLFVFEVIISLDSIKTKTVTYSKEGSIVYNTYLKKNNYYANTYLDDKYNIIASLIDYIKSDFRYVYTLNEKIDYELSYNVKAKLIVYDTENNEKPIYTEDFTLIDDKTIKDTSQVIKVELFNEKIDYNRYNKIVQNLKTEISPEASLVVTFNVRFNGFSKTLNKELMDSYVNNLTIPLYKKTISISEADNNVSTSKEGASGSIVIKEPLERKYLIIMISTIVAVATFVVLLIINVIKHGKKKSKFDLKVKKILREFDRAITESNSKLVINSSDHKIKISDFMELLDVHDNLNAPIIYYKTGDDKATFVVRNGKDIYYTELKRKDFDD